jgi:hypothetical protein
MKQPIRIVELEALDQRALPFGVDLLKADDVRVRLADGVERVPVARLGEVHVVGSESVVCDAGRRISWLERRLSAGCKQRREPETPEPRNHRCFKVASRSACAIGRWNDRDALRDAKLARFRC